MLGVTLGGIGAASVGDTGCSTPVPLGGGSCPPAWDVKQRATARIAPALAPMRTLTVYRAHGGSSAAKLRPPQYPPTPPDPITLMCTTRMIHCAAAWHRS